MDFSLSEVIKNNIRNENNVFVFPTDIAAQKWADWVIKNTDILAVPMEKFIAWDTFKGECIKSKVEGLSSVPSLMRKIFASWLIERNADELFFTEVISPEYAKNASAFSDWITKILPSLGIWKKLYDHQLLKKNEQISFEKDGEDESSLKAYFSDYEKQNFCDGEDKDLLLIYEKYSNFLKENNCFEPAWIDPDFNGDGKNYFIVYPEILEDWQQYEYKLSDNQNIQLIHVPEKCGEYQSYFFDNARTELRDAVLFLRTQYEKGINWADMAISVPDLNNYGSYLDRELSLYEIPHSMRYSKELSSYGAGNLFNQLKECVENGFSYDSVKNLLLNDEIPWNQKSVIDDLLLFGKINNCICSFDNQNKTRKRKNNRKETVWDLAFDNPKDDGGTGLNKSEAHKILYDNLVELIPSLVNALTFEEIRSAYEDFKDKFFDMQAFQTMALSNNVLSRCISALNELCDLEKKYSQYRIASPYSFFVNHLSSVQYLPQGENFTVQVLPYRTAAPAPFKIHLIVDAAQDSLSVSEMFKSLGFINENKRRIFMKYGELDKDYLFRDTDPSFEFIKLYTNLSTEITYFTAAKHSFNGSYGFAHGKIENTVDKIPSAKKNVEFRKDSFGDEKGFLLGENINLTDSMDKIFPIQKNGFEKWIQRKEIAGQLGEKTEQAGEQTDNGEENAAVGEEVLSSSEEIASCIKERLSYVDSESEKALSKAPELLNKYKVSQSMLNAFWICPRRWFFKEILQVKPLNNEAELIDQFIMGTVNHKIFEIYFKLLKEKKLPLRADEKNTLSQEYRKYLVKAMNAAVDSENEDSAFKSFMNVNSASYMTKLLIASQYKVDENNADSNLQFKMLEKSIATLSNMFSGFSVFAMEKNLNALVYDENGNAKDYYFNGKIDCILEGPNHTDYTVIDFKTASIEKNIFVKNKVMGNLETLVDFQMPMYVYILKNAVNKEDRLDVTNCLFYSIKQAKGNFYLGNSVNEVVKAETVQKLEENAPLAEFELLTYAEEFYQRLKNQDFGIDKINQSQKKCKATGQYNNCIDYQAICRRYFTVCGDNK